MIKFIILIFVLLYGTSFFACTSPITGEQYNSQIKVQYTPSEEQALENVFIISFPAVVENLKFEIAELIVMKSKNENGPYVRVPVSLKEKEGIMYGSIYVNEQKGLSFHLGVMWSPNSIGLCSITALIKLERI